MQSKPAVKAPDCWACGNIMQPAEKRGARGRKLRFWRCDLCDLEVERKTPAAHQGKLFDPGKRFVRADCPREDVEQIALMNRVKRNEGKHPDLKLVFCVPNGGWRHKAVAKLFKALGVRPGVPDLCAPVPRGEWGGLFIEMKRLFGGDEDDLDQKFWAEELRKRRFRVVMCRGCDEAWSTLITYLEIPEEELVP